MTDNIISKKPINTMLLMVTALIMTFTLNSCDYSYDLPEAGSIPDATPPSAGFGYSVSPDDYLTIKFNNGSSSATDYQWNFGDGNSSTDKEPTNAYPEIGEYQVTLIASDKLGAESTVTNTVLVVEPAAILPVIQEASFELGTLPGGGGDGRDSWRTDMGGVIQITSSPVHSGEAAAKFPSAGDRVGYQELTVSPDTDYIITYYYTMKESGDGSMTVAILSGGITDLDDAEAATIIKNVGTDQTDDGAYVKVDLYFNTEDTTTIAILMTNIGVESRVDSFSMKLAE